VQSPALALPLEKRRKSTKYNSEKEALFSMCVVLLLDAANLGTAVRFTTTPPGQSGGKHSALSADTSAEAF
jgi:hypothetical protein